MSPFEVFGSFGLALAAGLLIGSEREQSAREDGRALFLGGARTHPVVALIGAASLMLGGSVGVLVGLVSVSAFLLLAYADDLKKGLERGLTSEFAFLLSFLLGALAAANTILGPLEERAVVVASIAVVATLLLSSKPLLHGVLRKASQEDVFATLKFLVVAVVILPLLPNRAYGPLEVLNPRNIGLMVVLIAGISFVGYVAIRVLGARRGLGLTGLVGGLISSTAVTLSFSGRAKEHPQLAASCALAIALASSIMFVRVLLEVAVVNSALLGSLVLPMGAMFVAGLGVSAWLVRRSKAKAQVAAQEVQFSNPFELSSALKFAALFAGVLFVSKAATTYLGNQAVYLTGLLAGTTDVDAITLSMARLAQGGSLAPEVAVTTILLGVASNTVVKASMAAVVGGWAFGRQLAGAFGVVLLAGGLGLVAVWL